MEIGELKSLLSYEPDTGLFRWRKYRSRLAKPGDIAGTKNAAGYIQIMVGRKIYYAHRLAWAFLHGSFPEEEIDHEDCDPSNNKASNLRPATSSQQKFNTRTRRDNSTGIKGVSYCRRREKFVARVASGGVYILRKQFASLDEAANAAMAARELAHQEYANHGGSNGDH